jgi:hypothetical protein
MRQVPSLVDTSADANLLYQLTEFVDCCLEFAICFRLRTEKDPTSIRIGVRSSWIFCGCPCAGGAVSARHQL